MPMDAMSASTSAAGSGNRCVRPSVPPATARPKRATRRPASVEAARTLTCCPRMARTAISNGSTAPRAPRSPRGARPHGRCDHPVAGQMRVDARRVRVQVEQRAHARDEREEVGAADAADRHEQVRPGRRATHRDRPGAFPRGALRHDALVRGVVHALDARDGTRAEEREQLLEGQRLAVRQPQHDRVTGVARPRRCGLRAAARTKLGRRGVERGAHRLVEPPHAREPGGVRHLGHRKRRLLEQLAREVDPLRVRDLQRRRAQVTVDESPQVPRRHPGRSPGGSTPASSSAPCAMSRSARVTVAGVPSAAGVPGAASGLHRRHGRSPAACAAAVHG